MLLNKKSEIHSVEFVMRFENTRKASVKCLREMSMFQTMNKDVQIIYVDFEN